MKPCILLALLSFIITGTVQASETPEVKVTILSTMITDYGSNDHATHGEWGFSALVEVDGKKILFDAGRTPGLVLKNAKILGIDLSDVEDVVLSHFHDDHTGGFLSLRKELMKTNPKALSRLHVNKGFFYPRRFKTSDNINYDHINMTNMRQEFEETGGTVYVYDKANELLPGVWLSGPVSRNTNERNWSGATEMLVSGKWEEDIVPESLSMFINTPKGTIIISGCGHAGIINITHKAKAVMKTDNIHAAIGGFHLLGLKSDKLKWTADQLKLGSIEHFIGAHCTGIEATFELRDYLGLTRKEMMNGAVGASFTYGKGINPGWIAG